MLGKEIGPIRFQLHIYAVFPISIASHCSLSPNLWFSQHLPKPVNFAMHPFRPDVWTKRGSSAFREGKSIIKSKNWKGFRTELLAKSLILNFEKVKQITPAMILGRCLLRSGFDCQEKGKQEIGCVHCAQCVVNFPLGVFCSTSSSRTLPKPHSRDL
jgi:hypothetical protein